MTTPTPPDNEKADRVAEDELGEILDRYKSVDVEEEVSTYAGLVALSARFYRDAAEVYDVITRMRHLDRNPGGFDLNDAPILGLLVRVWKILKEIVSYYRRGNGDMVAMLSRQMTESTITAHYLLISSDEVIEDYRKCGYKSRIETLERSLEEPEFFNTPPGKRLLSSIRKKLDREGFTIDSFELQRKRRWKLQGMNFRQIFAKVVDDEMYRYLYGYASEAIHGSWNESLDYDLLPNGDGTFKPFPLYQEVDIRAVTPILRLCHAPYRLWVHRVGLEGANLTKVLDWIEAMNMRQFHAFEATFGQTERGRRENERGGVDGCR